MSGLKRNFERPAKEYLQELEKHNFDMSKMPPERNYDGLGAVANYLGDKDPAKLTDKEKQLMAVADEVFAAARSSTKPRGSAEEITEIKRDAMKQIGDRAKDVIEGLKDVHKEMPKQISEERAAELIGKILHGNGGKAETIEIAGKNGKGTFKLTIDGNGIKELDGGELKKKAKDLQAVIDAIGVEPKSEALQEVQRAAGVLPTVSNTFANNYLVDLKNQFKEPEKTLTAEKQTQTQSMKDQAIMAYIDEELKGKKTLNDNDRKALLKGIDERGFDAEKSNGMTKLLRDTVAKGGEDCLKKMSNLIDACHKVDKDFKDKVNALDRTGIVVGDSYIKPAQEQKSGDANIIFPANLGKKATIETQR